MLWPSGQGHAVAWSTSPRNAYFKLHWDPVNYTVPDPQVYDIKLNTFKTCVARKFTIILQNWTTINERKSGKSKYDRKLTKLDVVTTWIRYRVNGSEINQFQNSVLTDVRRFFQFISHFYLLIHLLRISRRVQMYSILKWNGVKSTLMKGM